MPLPRSAQPDVTPFEPVMAQALLAYSIDPSYAIAMATKAVTVLAKQATWKARLAMREAEATAREECAAAGTFTCAATAPCGSTTQCRFSRDEFRELVVTDQPLGPMRGGKVVARPQPGPDGAPTAYNLEAAVLVLRDQREGPVRPA